MRAQRLGVIAFAVALAATVLSVWSVRYFPTQDGPFHLEGAGTWAALDAGLEPHMTLFETRAHLAPYWSIPLLLRGFLEVFEPVVAHSVIVTMLVAGFGLASWYAMKSVRSDGARLAVLTVPFAASWSLHMGFFSFVAGTCLFLLTIGFWIRHGRRPNPHQATVLVLLLVATYLTHLIPLLASWAVLAVLALSWAAERSTADESYFARFWHTVRLPFVAAMPSLLLTGAYVASATGSASMTWRLGDPVRWVSRAVTLFAQLVSFDRLELVPVIALAVLVGVGAVVPLVVKIRSHRFTWEDGLLVAAGLLTLVALLVPNEAVGGGMFRDRFTLFPALLVLLWLSAQALDWRLETALIIGGLAISLVLVGLHARVYRAADHEIQEVVSASVAIEEGSVVLPISFIPSDDPVYWRVRPLLHAPSWSALERSGINLGNPLPAVESSYIRYRPAIDPEVHLVDVPGGFESPPPRGDLIGYQDRTGTEIDYVLVIGLDRGTGFEAEKRALFEELNRRYDLVYRSEPNGLVLVYSRR